MPLNEWRNKNIAIWGLGKEGQAAAALCHELNYIFLDEEQAGPTTLNGHPVVRGDENIAAALKSSDVLIKSPGVSLYHKALKDFKARGGHVTSLLNVWFKMRNDTAFTIGITGSKGKTTTCSLLAHCLSNLGKDVLLLGNIGTPVTAALNQRAEYIVLELSSYQTADFDGTLDIALVTSLFPDHLPWHGDETTYYRDKLALLNHAPKTYVHRSVLERAPFALPPSCIFYDTAEASQYALSPYLMREHNRANVSAVITVLAELGFSPTQSIQAMQGFEGVAHRQKDLGERAGILYVDDSISTTVQSAIMALKVYHPRPCTLIAGGFDRGLDFSELVDYMITHQAPMSGVVCTGASGARLFESLHAHVTFPVLYEADFTTVVKRAISLTPKGGVVLLSPASPSFGQFRDYQSRGQTFAQLCGFETKVDP